jgi:Na+/citrate or Na+/malate symporter
LLALLGAHHILPISRIRVKLINLPLYYVLMILLVVEVSVAQFSDVILVAFLLILFFLTIGNCIFGTS